MVLACTESGLFSGEVKWLQPDSQPDRRTGVLMRACVLFVCVCACIYAFSVYVCVYGYKREASWISVQVS
jgi:hypothetical protein